MTAAEALRRRPFLIVSAPLAAGIALSGAVPGTALLWPSLAVLPILLFFRRRVVAWALVGLAAGVARAEWNDLRTDTDVLHLDRDTDVHITGKVLEAPRFYSPESGTFLLEIQDPRWTGRVRVQFYRSPPPLTGGEVVSIDGRLRPLRPPTNPGQYDRAASLERSGISATLSTSRIIGVVTPASPFRFATWTDRARNELRGLLARHAPPDVAALQAALLLGSREDLPPDLTSALQRSGTAHFLAVSGFNLVLVLVIFWYLLLACGVRGAAMPALLLVLLLGYTALTGWQVSVVRAFLMSAAVLGARLVWRRSDVINSLCVAALAILLWDPAQLFDIGFQLSFVAVLGIVGIGPIYHEFLAPAPGPLQSRVPAWIGRQARGALAVSIGAWLATAPIVLATFNLVTPVILGANLALCPLVTIQSVLALVTLPLAALFPPGAALAGGLATSIFEATAWSADFLTRLPAAFLYQPALPPWAVVLYYAALGLWTWRGRVLPDRRKPWLCTAFAFSLALPALMITSKPAFGLLDVGRGSCAYVRSSQGTLLFDCGSLSYRDPGAMVAAPVLWSQGVVRAHTLILSHADSDHVNGAQSVIERLGVGRLIVPPGFDHPVLAFARDRGLEVVVAHRGQAIPGLEILGPPPDVDWPVNERSLVVRVTTPAGRILFPGDIEELGTRALLDSGADLRSEILVLPHHGKRQDLHRELIAAVSPRIVLVSAPDGYSSREVVDHARSAASVYQTGFAGWIEVDLSPGLKVRQFRGD